MKSSRIGAFVTFSVFASAEAAISYIDASPANTTNLPPADGSVVGGWRGRGAGLNQGTANFANEGGAYEANGNEAATTNLTTTVTTLNGSYNAFAFFWSDTGTWDIATAIAGQPLQQYTTNSPGVFAINTASQAVPETSVSGLNVLGQTPDDYSDFVDGNRTLYAVPLGTQTVTNGQLQFEIDGSSLTSDRTWYDGVGFSVIPEPSALALLSVGLLGAFRRRR